MTADPATFHKPVKRARKRSKGCKHARVWSVISTTSIGALQISTSTYPGVKIEAARIDLCHGCSKFRVIGADKHSSAWASLDRFLTKRIGQV